MPGDLTLQKAAEIQETRGSLVCHRVPFPAFHYTADLIVDFVRLRVPTFRTEDAESALLYFCDPTSRKAFGLKNRFYQDALPYEDEDVLRLYGGACELSDDFQWTFDLDASSVQEAIGWYVARVQENLAASLVEQSRWDPVQFPGRDWQAVGTWRKTETVKRGGTFGAVHPLQRSMLLESCGKPSKGSMERGLAHLRRWAPYILRIQWVSDPVFQFPPISHVVGTMVCHQEFSEKVALELYGIFLNCNVRLYLEADTREGKRDPSVDKPVAGISGLTVLFLACTIVSDEVACAKLLQMPTAGLRILKDLHDQKLGDFCSKVVRPQVKAMLQALFEGERNLTTTAWGQRLSLLVSLHLCRPNGKLATWEEMDYPEPLLLDVLRLGPSRIRSIPIEYEAAAIGFFAGNAVGTLIQLLSKRIIEREAKGRKHRSLVTLTTEWTTNLVSVGQSVAPMLVGSGGGYATPFSLQQTQGLLHDWIDERTARQTSSLRSACDHILELFDERLYKFGRRFGDDVDLGPFRTQGSQALKIALDADPQAHYDKAVRSRASPTRYRFLADCPSKHWNGHHERLWSNLFEKKLALVDRDDDAHGAYGLLIRRSSSRRSNTSSRPVVGVASN